jgi:hypothetical protein
MVAIASLGLTTLFLDINIIKCSSEGKLIRIFFPDAAP